MIQTNVVLAKLKGPIEGEIRTLSGDRYLVVIRGDNPRTISCPRILRSGRSGLQVLLEMIEMDS